MRQGLPHENRHQSLSNGREYMIGDEDNCTMSSASSTSSSSSSDESSSSPSSSSSSSSSYVAALYDLSDLMAQLPVKRGLSKYYEGKSESFKSLSRAISINDLPKKAKFERRRNGGHTKFILPKPDIKKKKKRIFSSSFSRRKTTFNTCGTMPPLFPLQNKQLGM